MSTPDTTMATPAVDLSRQLLAFNWLVAGYAHRDWLGPWAAIIEPRRRASLRLMQRASAVLIERHELRERWLRDVGTQGWLLQPHEPVMRLARTLGVAMLGGWVQRRLERQQVALQHQVLGADRARALEHAHQLRALPHPAQPWAVPLDGPPAVQRLGLSCLAALLDDEASGALERFMLRFSRGTVVALPLAARERDEALALVHAQSHAQSPAAAQGAA
jgi:hypothetical protein